RFTRIGVVGSIGQQIDFDNGREGTGADLSGTLTLHPTDHLELVGIYNRRWLDVPTPAGPKGRLFTATVARLKATYVFNAYVFLRLIGQWVETKRDPALYTFPIAAREGNFDGSVLLAYRLNWQTVAYLGYGDSHALIPIGEPDVFSHYRLAPAGRQFFLKLSYAFQR